MVTVVTVRAGHGPRQPRPLLKQVLGEMLAEVRMTVSFKTVTLDTNVFPAEALVARAQAVGLILAVVTVSGREANTWSLREVFASLDAIPESAVWGEFIWGQARWSAPATQDRLRRILEVISNKSYPAAGISRDLTSGEKRQLRDALIFEAHVRDGRDLFVSNDKRAFLWHPQRDLLTREFFTEIMSRDEFEAWLAQQEESPHFDKSSCREPRGR